MKETFINDIKEIFKDLSVDEILDNNADLRKKYCQYIYKKNSDFFEKTANKNGYEELTKVYNQNANSIDEALLKEQESTIVKKYLLFNGLSNIEPEKLEKLNQANTIMTSIKESDFETDLLYDGKSRADVISIIKNYDKEFYDAYTRLNEQTDNKVKYEINMIKMYEQYLKVKENRK